MLNLKLLFALLLALACQSALAQVMYRMQPLETLDGCSPNVTAFNNADQATGEICAGGSVHGQGSLLLVHLAGTGT